MAKKKAKKRSAAKSTDKKDVCFTIMPFGGWLDDYYEAVYRPAIEAAGLEPLRADDIYRPGTIINDICCRGQACHLLFEEYTQDPKRTGHLLKR